MRESSGQRVVVTGAASGIGFETAQLLTERGVDVYLVDLRAEALEQACATLGVPVTQSAALDVADEAAVDAALARAASIGPISGVVNSAGIVADKPTVETSLEDFRRILDVNLVGTFLVSRAAVRLWLSAEQAGSIVNVSSISGLCGNKGRSAYGASKGGVNLLTQVMANELGAAGIRINAVAPGPIDTPMAQAVHTQDVRRQWHARVPLRRYGTPKEVARTVAFLLFEEAGYITGQILAVDGGFVMAGLAT